MEEERQQKELYQWNPNRISKIDRFEIALNANRYNESYEGRSTPHWIVSRTKTVAVCQEKRGAIFNSVIIMIFKRFMHLKRMRSKRITKIILDWNTESRRRGSPGTMVGWIEKYHEHRPNWRWCRGQRIVEEEHFFGMKGRYCTVERPWYKYM